MKVATADQCISLCKKNRVEKVRTFAAGQREECIFASFRTGQFEKVSTFAARAKRGMHI